MTVQEKIQNKAEGFGKLAPVFLEGAKFALENQWISIDDDLPCNHLEMICYSEIDEGTETITVFARSEYGDIWSDYMVYKNSKWRWNNFEPAYWMIVPKLLKNRR